MAAVPSRTAKESRLQSLRGIRPSGILCWNLFRRSCCTDYDLGLVLLLWFHHVGHRSRGFFHLHPSPHDRIPQNPSQDGLVGHMHNCAGPHSPCICNYRWLTCTERLGDTVHTRHIRTRLAVCGSFHLSGRLGCRSTADTRRYVQSEGHESFNRGIILPIWRIWHLPLLCKLLVSGQSSILIFSINKILA